MTEPAMIEDWQHAVDAAYGALVLDSCRTYGLIEGGPIVHVERCEEILSRGESLGIRPSAHAVEDFMRELLGTGQ